MRSIQKFDRSTGSGQTPRHEVDLPSVVDLSRRLSSCGTAECVTSEIIRFAIVHLDAEVASVISNTDQGVWLEGSGFRDREIAVSDVRRSSFSSVEDSRSLLVFATLRSGERSCIDVAGGSSAASRVDSGEPREMTLGCIPLRAHERIVGALYYETDTARARQTVQSSSAAVLLSNLAGVALDLALNSSHRDGRRPAPHEDELIKDRFERTLAGSTDGIWDWNIVTDELYLSERAYELYGIQPKAAVRHMHDWWERTKVHPDDVADQIALVERLLTGTPPLEGRLRILYPDGNYRWVALRGKCTFENGGRPQKVAGSVSNIDDMMLAQQALRKSEDRYSRAVAGSSDGIWDWELPDEMFLSERAQQLLGLQPGASTRSLSAWQMEIKVHRNDLVAVRAFNAGLANGEGPIEAQWRVIHRDGSARWVAVRGLCVVDDGGSVIRAAGSISDIHTRTLVEQALRDSEERFALAVAGSNDGVWDWDIPSNQMFMSDRAQRLYGLIPGPNMRPREEWRTLVRLHPQDVEDQYRVVESYLNGRLDAYDGKWRVLQLDSTYRWVRVRGLCVRDAEGRATRLAGSISDIDQQVRTEAALVQSKRLEVAGTLAGGIAHDFNNILSAVLGYGEMALRDAQPGTRLRRDVESILVAGERGRALVNQILAFSRGGATSRVRVDMEAVVREAHSLVVGMLPESMSCELRLNAGPVAALGDTTKFHQVLMNLATNALQAMKDGGTLVISLDVASFPTPRACSTGALPTGEYILLSLSDTGAGIDAAILERIFDPFFTTKDAGAGTGLGLSIAHGIVKDAGGAIDVQTRLGFGTTFSIYLPRVGYAEDARHVSMVLPPRGKHQQILVVDDEPSLVTLMTENLLHLGYVPVGFTSSSDALAALRAHPERFDAVVTDGRMPGLSGAGLIREIRAAGNAVPIIMVSGFQEPAVPRQKPEAAPHMFLRKPVRLHELAKSIQTVLQTEKSRPNPDSERQ